MRKVIRECACAMCIPVTLDILKSVMEGTLGVITADRIGKFADAAFEQNLSKGAENAGFLAVCLIFAVFAVPAVGMLSDFIMFRKSLLHDKLVFGHYLDKRIEKAAEQRSGGILYELEDAPNTMRIQWVCIFAKAASLPVCLGYFLYSVGKISWQLAILMPVIAAVQLVIPVLFQKKLAGYDRQEKSWQAKRRDCETDAVTRPYLAKLWGMQKGMISRMDTLFWNYYRCSAVHQIKCSILSVQTQELAGQAAVTLLLLSGALLTAQGVVTPGEAASLFLYLTVLQGFFGSAGDIIRNYPLFQNAAERVCVFYEDEEPDCGERLRHFTDLCADGLEFSYPDTTVLEHLDFKITAGEKVRICGENGCGKSTLLKITGSLLDSYEGSIKAGGLELKTIHRESWRNLIAYAPQTPLLFQATVRENILAGCGAHLDKNTEPDWDAGLDGNPEPDQNADGDSYIMERKKEADDLMRQLGIFHLADQKFSAGSDFSGGEKQKISLARALLKRAEILILDEPFNYLDLESIRFLKKYLRETEQTVLLVSHDAAFSDVTDRCIFLL